MMPQATLSLAKESDLNDLYQDDDGEYDDDDDDDDGKEGGEAGTDEGVLLCSCFFCAAANATAEANATVPDGDTSTDSKESAGAGAEDGDEPADENGNGNGKEEEAAEGGDNSKVRVPSSRADLPCIAIPKHGKLNRNGATRVIPLVMQPHLCTPCAL
jgi:hypothetical protein